MSKKLPRDQILERVKSVGKLTPLEETVFSLSSMQTGNSSDNEYPFIALKYFQDDFECFSDWEKDELKSFSAFVSDLRQRTWRQVLSTSGKGGNKTGLGYTPYNISTIKGAAEKHLKGTQTQIGEDITFFELRVTQKMRVHGFRAKAAFFLVLLDREHQVFPD